MLRQDVSKVEVGIKDAIRLGLVPIDCYGRFDLDEPFKVYRDEVIAVDAHPRHVALAHYEVGTDELPQLLVISVISEERHALVQFFLDERQHQAELPRRVVGRPHAPIKIIHVKHIEHGVVGDEAYLFGIKRTEERRRKLGVERPRLANRNDELHE